MKEDLRLTESQQVDAKRLLDDYKRDVETLRGASKPDPDMGKKYADIRKQLEEARAAKDQARQQQLMDQMKNDRTQREAQEEPIRAGIEQATKTLHDRLVGGLGEKQKQGFESLWQDALAGKRGRANRINPNQLKAAVMKLPNLAEDQKKQVEELFKTHDKAASDTKNPVDRQKVTQKLYENVLALLNAEQKDKLKAEMDGAARGRNRDRVTKSESKGG
jgi:hypothetical protein